MQDFPPQKFTEYQKRFFMYLHMKRAHTRTHNWIYPSKMSTTHKKQNKNLMRGKVKT